MDVSVIIINYNTFQLTCNCISSLIEKTTGISYEIILVDNASTECSPELFLNRFPNIILIKNPKNLGFAKGNNIGIDKAIGKIILLLNSDTELIENTISICYNELMYNTDVDIITCNLIFPDNSIQHNCQSFPSAVKILLEKTRLHKLLSKKKQSMYLQGSYWDYEKYGFPDWVWGTFFMFRRNILTRLPNKKLNDDFFMYIEDMKWCWDICQFGSKILYTPKTKIIHHSGGSLGKVNVLVTKNHQDFLKNNYNFFNKIIINFINKI